MGFGGSEAYGRGPGEAPVTIKILVAGGFGAGTTTLVRSTWTSTSPWCCATPASGARPGTCSSP